MAEARGSGQTKGYNMPNETIEDICKLISIGGYTGDINNIRGLIETVYKLGRVDGNLEAIKNMGVKS